MKKITYEKAKNRFLEQGRTDITLCEDDYNGWKEKSKFWDEIIKDWFWAIPKNVFMQKSTHPKRAMENRKSTNIEKYGSTCSLHGITEKGEKIKEKVKETLIEKYGVDNPFKSKKIKEKIMNKLKEKYGTENISKLEEIKKKKKETIIKKYGVSHQMLSENIKEKIKKTNLEKYNTTHPSKNEEIKIRKKNTFKKKYNVEHPFNLPGIVEKKNKTMIEKYGTTNSWLKPTKIILENNLSIKEWYHSQTNLMPSYGWIMKHFVGRNEISQDELTNIISNFHEKKSSLEILSEKIFNLEYYNKKVEKIEKNYKPDFKFSSEIFLNVDGLYWHSDMNKDKWYHFNLRKDFENANLRIFQFREDDIRDKSDIVKSIINNALGKNANIIYARKCKINTVSQASANVFLKENHLMGTTNAKHLGLYFENKLISILSYKKKRNICKIERFCSTINSKIIGGFSKLLSHLEKRYLSTQITQIHNWVDLRYGTGKHLENKGFILIKDILSWKWTDYNYTYNRLRCKANMDSRNLTEKEYAEELGWERIYDAGQRLYVKYR